MGRRVSPADLGGRTACSANTFARVILGAGRSGMSSLEQKRESCAMSGVESGHIRARRRFYFGSGVNANPRSPPASLQQRHAAPPGLRGGGLSGGPPPSDHARRVCGPRDRAEDGPGAHHQKHWNVSSCFHTLHFLFPVSCSVALLYQASFSPFVLLFITTLYQHTLVFFLCLATVSVHSRGQ